MTVICSCQMYNICVVQILSCISGYLGVGAGKLNFCLNFPKLARKNFGPLLCEYFLMKTVLGIISSKKDVGCPFCFYFQGDCPDFQGFCEGFHRFFPDFPGFLPNQNFWGCACHPFLLHHCLDKRITLFAEVKNFVWKLLCKQLNGKMLKHVRICWRETLLLVKLNCVINTKSCVSSCKKSIKQMQFIVK